MDDITPLKIPAALATSICHSHNRGLYEPCWVIHTGRGRMLPAICNRRARKAGFNAKISEESLSKKKR